MKTFSRALLGLATTSLLAACGDSNEGDPSTPEPVEDRCDSGWKPSGSEECLDWTTCSATEFEAEAPTATSDRVCEPLTVCEPGSFESLAPTESSDRECAPCPEGSYCPGDGASVLCGDGFDCPEGTVEQLCAEGSWIDQSSNTCRPLSVCPEGKTESVPPTATSDRVCSSCGFNLWENGDGECVEISACLAGEFQASAPTEFSDRECAPCPDGSFCPDGVAPPQAHTPVCAAGTYETQSPSETQDRVCSACPEGNFCTGGSAAPTPHAASCVAGEWETTAPSEALDRVCSTCPSGNFCTGGTAEPQAISPACVGGTYQTQAATTSQDRVCTSCPIGTFCTGGSAVPQPHSAFCAAGTYQSQAPSSSADRVCSPCPAGTYCTGGTAAPTPHTVCTAGTYVTQHGTAMSNRVCGTCTEGNFCTGGNAQPQPLSTSCAEGEYIASPGTASHNIVCREISECGNSQVERFDDINYDGTGTRDQECCATVGESGVETSIAGIWPVSLLGNESCLISIGRIKFGGAPSFPPIPWIEADGIQVRQTNLSDLSILSDLERINGSVNIDQNPYLTSLTGWPTSVTTVGDNLSLVYNVSLSDISALNVLQVIGANGEGSFSIYGSSALTSLPAFDNLVAVNGNLDFYENGITSISGFNALSMLGQLAISSNHWLTSISGFTNLEAIQAEYEDGVALFIYSNANLRRISGFTSLTSIFGDAWIQQNPELCAHDVDAIVNRANISDMTFIHGINGSCL